MILLGPFPSSLSTYLYTLILVCFEAICHCLSNQHNRRTTPIIGPITASTLRKSNTTPKTHTGSGTASKYQEREDCRVKRLSLLRILCCLFSLNLSIRCIRSSSVYLIFWLSKAFSSLKNSSFAFSSEISLWCFFLAFLIASWAILFLSCSYFMLLFSFLGSSSLLVRAEDSAL